MPFATGLLAGVIGAVGVATSVVGTIESVQAQNRAAEAEKEQQQVKQLQLNIDAARQTRDIARKAMLARSTALVNATNQGAQSGSGLQGGYAQISGQEGSGNESVNQNVQLGQQMFTANNAETDARTSANTWNGIVGFGNQIYQNRDMLGRVGTYATQGMSSWF